MKITYDDEGYTSYLYFTSIGEGGVTDTIAADVTVDFDEDGQIIRMRLFEPAEWKFGKRLKYIQEKRHASFDESNHCVSVRFVEEPKPAKSIPWSAYIDLDNTGQIAGFELLFACPGWRPNDGQERVYAEGSLKHISKFRGSYEDFD